MNMRPRPRIATGTNPMLRNKMTPQKTGGQGAGVVPPKMAGGAMGARKAALTARAKAAGAMKTGGTR